MQLAKGVRGRSEKGFEYWDADKH